MFQIWPFVTSAHSQHFRSSCLAGLYTRRCILNYQALRDVSRERLRSFQIWFRMRLAFRTVFCRQKMLWWVYATGFECGCGKGTSSCVKHSLLVTCSCSELRDSLPLVQIVYRLSASSCVRIVSSMRLTLGRTTRPVLPSASSALAAIGRII